MNFILFENKFDYFDFYIYCTYKLILLNSTYNNFLHIQ